LFRRVILASASIPIAFPPVYFKVEVGGEEYDEMHVDGGVTKQVFFLYDVLIGMDKALKAKRIDMSKVKYSIYVIRNGYSDPVWQEIRDEISSIAERTLDTMTNAQSTGDLYQLYLFTSVSNGDFNLAYIPSTSKWHSKELFDKEVMKKLFDLGFAQAEKGYAWQKVPPGFDPEIAKKQ
ncbi:MAG TPA: patatin family protein, partial [Candidatus Omnitrophota bacterium]|nr:patatin family protein [Candidatus Omnitrophota bacterium]